MLFQGYVGSTYQCFIESLQDFIFRSGGVPTSISGEAAIIILLALTSLIHCLYTRYNFLRMNMVYTCIQCLQKAIRSVRKPASSEPHFPKKSFRPTIATSTGRAVASIDYLLPSFLPVCLPGCRCIQSIVTVTRMKLSSPEASNEVSSGGHV